MKGIEKAVMLLIAVFMATTVAFAAETKNSSAMIDYSTAADGYVTVEYTASTTKRIKVQVKGPTTTYVYNVTAGKLETLPLSDGNGTYQVTVCKNTNGVYYTPVLSAKFSVEMKDEFAPFLHSNQYVDFAAAPKSIDQAKTLTNGLKKNSEKIKAIYDFVVSNMTYDREKAKTVQSGYLPILDTALEEKKGICFDYAALMAGMLRSQGIPCKLVVGYAGTTYHAWVEYYDAESMDWVRADPTFASSGKQSDRIMEYIGDGSHYTARYYY